MHIHYYALCTQIKGQNTEFKTNIICFIVLLWVLCLLGWPIWAEGCWRFRAGRGEFLCSILPLWEDFHRKFTFNQCCKYFDIFASLNKTMVKLDVSSFLYISPSLTFLFSNRETIFKCHLKKSVNPCSIGFGSWRKGPQWSAFHRWGTGSQRNQMT